MERRRKGEKIDTHTERTAEKNITKHHKNIYIQKTDRISCNTGGGGVAQIIRGTLVILKGMRTVIYLSGEQPKKQLDTRLVTSAMIAGIVYHGRELHYSTSSNSIGPLTRHEMKPRKKKEKKTSVIFVRV